MRKHTTQTTSTDPVTASPAPTFEEMVTALEQSMSAPFPIGSLFGTVVYLNRWDRTVIINGRSVPVDHPYIKGTAVHAEALHYLGDAT